MLGTMGTILMMELNAQYNDSRYLFIAKILYHLTPSSSPCQIYSNYFSGHESSSNGWHYVYYI